MNGFYWSNIIAITVMIIIVFAFVFLLFYFTCCTATFYLIEPEKFLTIRACDHETPFERKHFGAVFFLDGLLEHPLRVFEPKKADLIFVPSLLDLVFTGKCNQYPRDVYLNDTIEVIHSTNLYPEKKHVMLVFSYHFKINRQKYKSYRSRLPGVVFAAWEDFAKSGDWYDIGCEFGVPYSNNYDYSFLYSGSQSHRIHLTPFHDPRYLPITRDSSYQSFMKRPLLVEFTGSVDTRPYYRDRYLLFNRSTPFFTARFEHPVWITTLTQVKTKNFHLNGLIGPSLEDCKNSTNVMSYIDNPTAFGNVFDRCRIELGRHESQVIREKAKFSLCFRGDTIGSDRWFNAFLSGTIIVTIGNSLEEVVSWTPFQEVIPWKDVIVFIPKTKYDANPVAAINDLAKLSQHDIERKLVLMKKHAADISFIAPKSRLVDNIIQAAMKTNCSHHWGSVK